MAKHIDQSAVVGYLPRFLQGSVPWKLEGVRNTIELPEDIYVGPFASIGLGAKIGNRCVIDAYCRVEPLATLGDDVMVLYRGTVGVSASVGNRCIIGGSVSENSIVEDDCTTFGKLIHSHRDSISSWDFRSELDPSPRIRRYSFVGHDSLVIGNIEVGPIAYVCAGATVTRSVPPYHIAHGVNGFVHYSKWPGQLANNPLFKLSV